MPRTTRPRARSRLASTDPARSDDRGRGDARQSGSNIPNTLVGAFFNAGINLTHLYHGQISFVDFFIAARYGLPAQDVSRD